MLRSRPAVRHSASRFWKRRDARAKVGLLLALAAFGVMSWVLLHAR
jgi:hypothetical protein